MKLFFVILIFGLSTPVFATNLVDIFCAGIAMAQDGTNVPAAVVFKKDAQSKYIESYVTISNWANLINPVTSDKLVNGQRVILRNSSSGSPGFSLTIQEPNSAISLATMDVNIPLDHIRSTQMVCLLKSI